MIATRALGLAVALAVVAFVALITTRDLAARAGTRARPVRRIADPAPLERLRRLGRTLTDAQTSDVVLVRDLRPLFRSIAAMRLAIRGVDLDRNQEKARAILGKELWDLVRSDGPRTAAGASAAGVQGLIERLERI